MSSMIGNRRSKWDQPAQAGGAPGLIPPGGNAADSSSPVEAAAAAAAKINAMLVAKGKLKLPAQQNQNSSKPKSSSVQPQQQNQRKEEVFMAEIEINDVPIGCRNLLTRGHTQDEVHKMSGAAVSTRGRYMSPEDKAKNNYGERPLYLCVQGPIQEAVDKAVNRIKEIIANGMKKEAAKTGVVGTIPGPRPPLLPGAGPPPPLMTQPPIGLPPPQQHLPPGMHYVQDKVFVGLEHAPPSFNVREKVLGVAGSYLDHIQRETGAKVQLRGKGSGTIETTSGREDFSPMYIWISHTNPAGLDQAKKLCENLLQTIHQEYAKYQQQIAAGIIPPPNIVQGVQPGNMTITTGLPPPAHVGQVGLSQGGPSPAPPPSSMSLPVGMQQPALLQQPAPGQPGLGMPQTTQLTFTGSPLGMQPPHPGQLLPGGAPPGLLGNLPPTTGLMSPGLSQGSMANPPPVQSVMTAQQIISSLASSQAPPPAGVVQSSIPSPQLQSLLPPQQQQLPGLQHPDLPGPLPGAPGQPQPQHPFLPGQPPPQQLQLPHNLQPPGQLPPGLRPPLPVTSNQLLPQQPHEMSIGGPPPGPSSLHYSQADQRRDLPQPPQKRRFTEEPEKEDLQAILGYQVVSPIFLSKRQEAADVMQPHIHGPPHLTNLGSGPASSQPQPPSSQPQHLQGNLLPPPGAHPGGPPPPHLLLPPPPREDERDRQLMPPPPRPPGMPSDRDRQLMPPPPPPSVALPEGKGGKLQDPVPMPGPPPKRMKAGPLVAYGEDSDEDEDGRHRDHYNQYHGPPQPQGHPQGPPPPPQGGQYPPPPPNSMPPPPPHSQAFSSLSQYNSPPQPLYTQSQPPFSLSPPPSAQSPQPPPGPPPPQQYSPPHSGQYSPTNPNPVPFSQHQPMPFWSSSH
ncbi:uncharacterized protein LOC144911235 isoform X3 [Branchiostoma floridae x Branchiostoma belcheri]